MRSTCQKISTPEACPDELRRIAEEKPTEGVRDSDSYVLSRHSLVRRCLVRRSATVNMDDLIRIVTHSQYDDLCAVMIDDRDSTAGLSVTTNSNPECPSDIQTESDFAKASKARHFAHQNTPESGKTGTNTDEQIGKKSRRKRGESSVSLRKEEKQNGRDRTRDSS